MRVFARKNFVLRQYEEKDGRMQVAVEAGTTPMAIVDLPDWVAKDPLFEWARADGDIEVIESRADEIQVELNAGKIPSKGNKVKSEKVLGNAPAE